MEAGAGGFRRNILDEFILHSPAAAAAFQPPVPARTGHGVPAAVSRAGLQSPIRDNQAEFTPPFASNHSSCRALAMIATAGIAVIPALPHGAAAQRQADDDGG
jgi:hypothetical protein